MEIFLQFTEKQFVEFWEEIFPQEDFKKLDRIITQEKMKNPYNYEDFLIRLVEYIHLFNEFGNDPEMVLASRKDEKIPKKVKNFEYFYLVGICQDDYFKLILLAQGNYFSLVKKYEHFGRFVINEKAAPKIKQVVENAQKYVSEIKKS